ncbi:UNVERIFIED_CONTAM: hypothetical protein Sindi_2623000 [Sesamum indicum]
MHDICRGLIKSAALRPNKLAHSSNRGKGNRSYLNPITFVFLLTSRDGHQRRGCSAARQGGDRRRPSRERARPQRRVAAVPPSLRRRSGVDDRKSSVGYTTKDFDDGSGEASAAGKFRNVYQQVDH